MWRFLAASTCALAVLSGCGESSAHKTDTVNFTGGAHSTQAVLRAFRSRGFSIIDTHVGIKSGAELLAIPSRGGLGPHDTIYVDVFRSALAAKSYVEMADTIGNHVDAPNEDAIKRKRLDNVIAHFSPKLREDLKAEIEAALASLR